MEEDDSDFDEEEYNKLEEEIEQKGELLIDLRSKQQCLNVVGLQEKHEKS